MGQVFYTPDGMRAAYDRGRDHQLKQVMQWSRRKLISINLEWLFIETT
jgi:hypothetical protein